MTQNEIDQANVVLALGWLTLIDGHAEDYVAADNAFLDVIQRLRLPIDNNEQLKVATDKYYQQDILRDSAGWNGKVTGWGKGIQVRRSIAARPENADNQELQDSLVFPATPQSLVTYAAANGIPRLRIES